MCKKGAAGLGPQPFFLIHKTIRPEMQGNLSVFEPMSFATNSFFYVS